jgi:hypothetical protein
VGVVLKKVIHCRRKMAEDINGKAGGIHSYCGVATVQCSVLGPVVTQAVSSQSSTANGRVLSLASACEHLLEKVTL